MEIIASGVYLRKNSYIGIKSSIIENVKLKEGCRVMPHSLINKNEKNYSILFGCPAKLIGFDK